MGAGSRSETEGGQHMLYKPPSVTSGQLPPAGAKVGLLRRVSGVLRIGGKIRHLIGGHAPREISDFLAFLRG